MLNFTVKAMAWPEASWRDDGAVDQDLFLVMLAFGRRNRALCGLPEERYAQAKEALLWTLDYALGSEFDDASRAAWSRAYDLVARAMRMGCEAQTPRIDSIAPVHHLFGRPNAPASRRQEVP